MTIIQVLKDESPGKDVKVRIGDNSFGGIWFWDKDRKEHKRILTDDLIRTPRLLRYVQGLPLIKIKGISSI